jgi:quinol monooxygenase YgiN
VNSNQSPFIVTVTFSVKPRYISRMRLIARDLTLASRVEDGCLLYQFAESREMKNHLLLYMIWKDEEAFNRYGDLPLVRAFDSGVAEELLTEPYVITTWSLLG